MPRNYHVALYAGQEIRVFDTDNELIAKITSNATEDQLVLESLKVGNNSGISIKVNTTGDPVEYIFKKSQVELPTNSLIKIGIDSTLASPSPVDGGSFFNIFHTAGLNTLDRILYAKSYDEQDSHDIGELIVGFDVEGANLSHFYVDMKHQPYNGAARDFHRIFHAEYSAGSSPGADQVNMTLGGNVVITGDLTVRGSQTVLNTSTLEVEDNVIVLNQGETGAGVTAGTAGIEIDRGTASHQFLIFDETDDLWKIGVSGGYQAIATREWVGDNYLPNGSLKWENIENKPFETLNSTEFSVSNGELSIGTISSGKITFDTDIVPSGDHNLGSADHQWSTFYHQGALKFKNFTWANFYYTSSGVLTAIGGGGMTIVGAGESAQALRDQVINGQETGDGIAIVSTGVLNPGDELLWFVADQGMRFTVNAQTYANKVDAMEIKYNDGRVVVFNGLAFDSSNYSTDYLSTTQGSSDPAGKLYWGSKALATEDFAQGVAVSGGSLFLNGDAAFDFNPFDTGAEFVEIYHDDGASGKTSFLVTGNHAIRSHFIEVNPDRIYRLSGWFKSIGSGGNSLIYFGIQPYDKDLRQIARQHVYRKIGTETTLADDLNPGDTTVKIHPSTEPWFDDSYSSGYRYIGFWPDTWEYPEYTYTRLVAQYSNYTTNTDGTITINLTSAWSGDVIPAGTPTANMVGTGGTYQYIAAAGNYPPSDDWVLYGGEVSGYAYGDYMDSQQDYVKFRYGTKYVHILLLANFSQDDNHQLLFDNIRFTEDPYNSLLHYDVYNGRVGIGTNDKAQNPEAILTVSTDNNNWGTKVFKVSAGNNRDIISVRASGTFQIDAQLLFSPVHTFTTLDDISEPALYNYKTNNLVISARNNITTPGNIYFVGGVNSEPKVVGLLSGDGIIKLGGTDAEYNPYFLIDSDGFAFQNEAWQTSVRFKSYHFQAWSAGERRFLFRTVSLSNGGVSWARLLITNGNLSSMGSREVWIIVSNHSGVNEIKVTPLVGYGEGSIYLSIEHAPDPNNSNREVFYLKSSLNQYYMQKVVITGNAIDFVEPSTTPEIFTEISLDEAIRIREGKVGINLGGDYGVSHELTVNGNALITGHLNVGDTNQTTSRLFLNRSNGSVEGQWDFYIPSENSVKYQMLFGGQWTGENSGNALLTYTPYITAHPLDSAVSAWIKLGFTTATSFDINSMRDIMTITPTGVLINYSESSDENYKLWVGRNNNEGIGISVSDSGAILHMVQDETGTETHNMKFRLHSSASGRHYFAWEFDDGSGISTPMILTKSNSADTKNYLYVESISVGNDSDPTGSLDVSGDLNIHQGNLAIIGNTNDSLTLIPPSSSLDPVLGNYTAIIQGPLNRAVAIFIRGNGAEDRFSVVTSSNADTNPDTETFSVRNNGQIHMGVFNSQAWVNVEYDSSHLTTQNQFVLRVKDSNSTGGFHFAIYGESCNTGNAAGVYGGIGGYDNSEWVGVYGHSGYSASPAGKFVNTEDGGTALEVNGVSKFDARIDLGGPIIPITDNAYDLGSSSKAFRNIYAKDSIRITSTTGFLGLGISSGLSSTIRIWADANTGAETNLIAWGSSLGELGSIRTYNAGSYYQDLRFYVSNGVSGPNSYLAMVLKGRTGRLGIGTSNPTYKLTVAGTSSSDEIRSEIGLDLGPINHAPSPGLTIEADSNSQLESGTYYYYIAYVTEIGETPLMVFAQIDVPNDQPYHVKVTIPAPNDHRVTSIKIYRTNSDYWKDIKLVDEVDRSVTVYYDVKSNNDLGADGYYYGPNTTSKFITSNGLKVFHVDESLISIGRYAGSNTKSYYNIAIGNNVGLGQMGTRSVMIGFNAAASGSSRNINQSVIIGDQAGYNSGVNSWVYNNIFIGYLAGRGLESGNDNVFIGAYSGYSASGSEAHGNVGVGLSTLRSIVSGVNNIAIGKYSSYHLASGTHNITIGYYAGYNLTGSENLALGSYSMQNATSAERNIIIGKHAGQSIISGDYNVLLGAYVDVPNDNGRFLNIGNLIFGKNVYNGDTASSDPVSNGKVGILINNPTEGFHVGVNSKFEGVIYSNGIIPLSFTSTSSPIKTVGAKAFSGMNFDFIQFRAPSRARYIYSEGDPSDINVDDIKAVLIGKPSGNGWTFEYDPSESPVKTGLQLEWDNFAACIPEALVVYMSTKGHSATVSASYWDSDQSRWIEMGVSPSFNVWPGFVVIKLDMPSGVTLEHKNVKINIDFSWASNNSNKPVIWYIGLRGSYHPQNEIPIMTWDKDRNITLPANLHTVGKIQVGAISTSAALTVNGDIIAGPVPDSSVMAWQGTPDRYIGITSNNESSSIGFGAFIHDGTHNRRFGISLDSTDTENPKLQIQTTYSGGGQVPIIFRVTDTDVLKLEESGVLPGNINATIGTSSINWKAGYFNDVYENGVSLTEKYIAKANWVEDVYSLADGATLTNNSWQLSQVANYVIFFLFVNGFYYTQGADSQSGDYYLEDTTDATIVHFNFTITGPAQLVAKYLKV